jgi:signal peptidase I
MRSKTKTKSSRIFKWLFWILITWLFVRAFFFQGYTVPSESMEKTYVKGDRIVVNKLVFGARIPITPLSLPFSEKYIDWIELPYLRLPSFGEIKRNDVVVFNFPLDLDLPIDKRKEFVKRCKGLPGDKIEIHKGNVFVNVKTQPKTDKKAFFDPRVYPHSSIFLWNKDEIGPLIVPKKEMQIQLSKENYYLYKSIIELHEGNKIAILGNDIYVNGIKSKTYKFTQNYYYFLGDNESKSYDSRYWGFVPESHIIGKVSFKY